MTKVHLYQALIRSVVLQGTEASTLLVANMYTLDAFHIRCQRQILDVCWWVYVSTLKCRCFSGLVCQPLVTSYVIDAYLCLTTLHAWTLEYQHMMFCV